MPGTSHRARHALGSTIVALALALLAGALPIFGGASADNTRELIRVSFRPEGTEPVEGWRSDHGEPFDSRRPTAGSATTTPPPRLDGRARRLPIGRRERRPHDTFITMQPPKQRWGRWVMAVEHGTYRVTVDRRRPSGGGRHAEPGGRGRDASSRASRPTAPERHHDRDRRRRGDRRPADHRPAVPRPGDEDEARLGRREPRARRRARRRTTEPADDGAPDDAPPDHGAADDAARRPRSRRSRCPRPRCRRAGCGTRWASPAAGCSSAARTPISSVSSTAWPPPARPGCASASSGARIEQSPGPLLLQEARPGRRLGP